jgi:hypothetical protein
MPYKVVPQLKTQDRSGSRKAGENSNAPLKVQSGCSLMECPSFQPNCFLSKDLNPILSSLLTITALKLISLRKHAP